MSMITEERLKETIAEYNIKLKLIDEAIDKEMSRPFNKRRINYLVFLSKERAVYEFTSNELEKLSNEN